jgi:ABC-type bacteriocin/lantibiotic exporter with double-glycine peptidase domain
MSILRFVSLIPSVGRSTTKISAQVDPTSGRILIDGIDISKIGTHDLRSRLVGYSPL